MNITDLNGVPTLTDIVPTDVTTDTVPDTLMPWELDTLSAGAYHRLLEDNPEIILNYEFYLTALSSGQPIILSYGTTYVVTGQVTKALITDMYDGLFADAPMIDNEHKCVIFPDPVWSHDSIDQIKTHRPLVSETVLSRLPRLQSFSTPLLSETVIDAYGSGITLPSRFEFPTDRVLMPHQRTAVLSMAVNGGGYLADEVGLGKTGEFMCGFLASGAQFPLVVVTKKSLVGECAEEWGKWFTGSPSEILTGRASAPINPDTQLIVCNSDILAARVDDIIDMDPGGVVFDESHMFKNMKAKRTQGALTLAKYIRSTHDRPYIVVSSGTLFPNRPSELWAQLAIMGHESNTKTFIEAQGADIPAKITTKARRGHKRQIKPSLQHIYDWYFCAGHPSPFGWDNTGSSHEQELNDFLVCHGLIRRKKSDVYTPTPPLVTSTLKFSISDEQRQEYTAIEDEFKRYMMNELYMEADKQNLPHRDVSALISQLIAKINSAETIMKMTKLRTTLGDMKIEPTVEWIHQFMGEKKRKLIIFAYHKNVLEKLIHHPELQQYGVNALVAGQPPKKVQEIKAHFQDPSSEDMILVCYSGAREGHTLTASKDVLIVEIPFLPSWVRQMGGRCWARMSEQYPPHDCTIHLASLSDTLDDYLLDMINRKQYIFTQVIDDGEEDTAVIDDDSELLSLDNDVLSTFLTSA